MNANGKANCKGRTRWGLGGIMQHADTQAVLICIPSEGKGYRLVVSGDLVDSRFRRNGAGQGHVLQ